MQLNESPPQLNHQQGNMASCTLPLPLDGRLTRELLSNAQGLTFPGVNDGRPPNLAERYLRHLNVYKRVLAEEEAGRPGHEAMELSILAKRSQQSGAMWLHILLSAGFNDHRRFPFAQLRQQVGEKRWERRTAEFCTLPEVEAFVVQKTLGFGGV
ncbi:hypothetical protein VTK73DRAFT_8168 [Phialemonium thermophilum]|uniref:Uncharacterized protein n=1 Tax=Phialemonium thermophilum TaxID=223376 RepID=A0ABR3WA34_9PEZI